MLLLSLPLVFVEVETVRVAMHVRVMVVAMGVLMIVVTGRRHTRNFCCSFELLLIYKKIQLATFFSPDGKLRGDAFLPFIFAVSSLTANNIAIVNGHYYHDDHKDSSHTPDDDHPIRNICVYRKIT